VLTQEHAQGSEAIGGGAVKFVGHSEAAEESEEELKAQLLLVRRSAGEAILLGGQGPGVPPIGLGGLVVLD
jgi:hypothetical protein